VILVIYIYLKWAINSEISNNVVCMANVICLGKWQITCTATKSDHLCPSYSCPVSALLPPQLLTPFWVFLSGFTSLSLKSTFCAVFLAVSSCFYPQKAETVAYLVPLSCFLSSPHNTGAIWLISIFAHISEHQINSLCCLWLSLAVKNHLKKTKTVPLLCFFDSSCALCWK